MNPQDQPTPPVQQQYQQPGISSPVQEGSKSYIVAVLLSLFVGQLGIDRFYLGKIGTGVAKLLTAGGLGVWAIIDFFLIVTGRLRANDGLPLQGYAENNKVMRIVMYIVIGINVLAVIGLALLLIFSTSSGIQDKAKDTKRTTDLHTIQTQIESFYETSGYYPSLTDLNSASWRATNLKSFDAIALKDPSNSSCENASDTGNCLIALPRSGAYAYSVTNSEGASCETDDTKCVKYMLTANLQKPVNGKATFELNNLN